MPRNYRSEYDNYQSKPEQRKRNDARKKSRRKMVKAVGKMKLQAKTATPAIHLVVIFVFNQKQQTVLGINSLSVSQVSNPWQVGFSFSPSLLNPMRKHNLLT